jgi:hypothetical protein
MLATRDLMAFVSRMSISLYRPTSEASPASSDDRPV